MDIKEFVRLAIEEDIKDGDHSALACIPYDAIGKAKLLVKEDGIIAGIEIAKQIFQEFDNSIQFEQLIEDGSEVKYGDIAFYINGNSQKILGAERLVLNVMQRMSAIATLTKKYVNELNGLKTKVLDTRKTTPLLRFLEKEAVLIGGGHNHRMGLYDMIMLKDNHIDFAGNIEITRKGDMDVPGYEEVYMSYRVDEVPIKGKEGSRKVEEYEEFTARPDEDGKMKDVEDGVPDDVIEEGTLFEDNMTDFNK